MTSVKQTDGELPTEGLLIPEGRFAALDATEYKRYAEVTAPLAAVNEALSVSNRKEEILNDLHNGRDADFSVKTLDRDASERAITELKSLKRSLMADEGVSPEISQLYRWKINEDIAGLEMVLASNAGNGRAFDRYNAFIYSNADPVIYGAAIDWVAHDAESILGGTHPDNVKEAAQDVLDRVSPLRGYRELLKPSPEVFAAVRDNHMRKDVGFYGLLLAGIDVPSPKVPRERGDEIITQMLHDNLDADFSLEDAESTSWSVAARKGIVRRPKNYNMITKRFIGLAAGHEVGSHLVEFLNGQRGPLGLASTGLDRYEAGNEGRAVIREQVPYESFDDFGKIVRWRDIMRRYISIGYATGTGEDATHSSSETYDFMHAIDSMYAIKAHSDDPETARQKAIDKTDSLVVRVLKGTDGRGGAYLKDKVYLEGNIACWLAAELQGPQAVTEGDLGKFDINNPRHIAALQTVGLLPERD